MNSVGRHLILLLAPLACATAPLLADEKVEIKYLAPDAASVSQIKTSLALDKTPPGAVMEIHFFDTPSLTLLKDQHLALRLRKKGDTWTFTVKERPTTRQPDEVGLGGELETDESIATLDKVRSYSIDSKPSAASIKAALEQDSVQSLLSLAQRSFLEKRPHPIPWEKVRCFPKIEARRWTLTDFDNLSAESWQYPGGEVLEISYKAKAKNAATAEKKFATWLTAHAIKPEKSGGMKTSTVLETLSKHLPPR